MPVASSNKDRHLKTSDLHRNPVHVPRRFMIDYKLFYCLMRGVHVIVVSRIEMCLVEYSLRDTQFYRDGLHERSL